MPNLHRQPWGIIDQNDQSNTLITMKKILIAASAGGGTGMSVNSRADHSASSLAQMALWLSDLGRLFRALEWQR
jgi:hypothetical protein